MADASTDDHFEKDRRHHQAIAREYDRVVVAPREVGNDILFRRFGRFVRPGGRMLDLACGTGHMAMRFGDRFAEVVAVDHSEAMLAEARRKAQARGWSHVRFECCDAMDYLDRADSASFDCIACVGFLHHVPPEAVPQTMKRVARLLRPSGTLVVSEPIRVAPGMVPERVAEWNRRSLAARSGYSVDVEAPDEEPLPAELLLRSVEEADLALLRVQRSHEIFPHDDPPSLSDRIAIRTLNLIHGRSGNVLTLAARRG